ncbi:hypothetical protein QBC44DRAFT_328220 [Cladorrhinum sp. PSN332]|nr:hypothetical protein QBC44DRAFT_328220 [Cladorrhinum sp. PSN332]
MASIGTITVDTGPPKACETASIYSWYYCYSGHSSYAGCCNVNPCVSLNCPPTASGETISSTSIITTPLSLSLSLSLSSSTSSPIVTSTPPVPYTAPTTTDGGSSHGMSLPVSAIVGIVVGCGIAALFAALATSMWYGRHRRERREKRQHAQRLATPRSIDDESVPPGLESVFNPMASDGPGSVFDRAEGRMSKASRESFLGYNPPVRENYMSGTTQLGLANPIASPGIRNSYASGTPGHPASYLSPNSAMNPRHSVVPLSELDAAPVAELPTASESAQSKSNIEGITPTSEPSTIETKAPDGLRATLNSTPEERESNTYPNSWTKF